MTRNLSDNPAKRLEGILKEMKQQTTKPCRDCWREVLKSEDESTLLIRLAQLIKLADEVVATMREAFPQLQAPLQILSDRIKRGIATQNINGQWPGHTHYFTDDQLTNLEFVTVLLNERPQYRSMDSSSLSEIRDSLVKLREDIVASKELEPDVKFVMARHISKLLDSLDEYFITGAFPVLDATYATMGHIALDEKYRNALKDTSIGRRTAEALANVANTITVMTGLAQMSQLASPVFLQLIGN